MSDDESIHQEFIEHLNAVVDTVISIIDDVAVATNKLYIHNTENTAHPDLRKLSEASEWLVANYKIIDDKIAQHNVSRTAHPDIRMIISAMTTAVLNKALEELAKHAIDTAAHSDIRGDIIRTAADTLASAISKISEHNIDEEAHPNLKSGIDTLFARTINTTVPLRGGGVLSSGNLKFTIDQATVTAVGVVKQATDAEVLAGVENTKFITAKQFKTATANLSSTVKGMIVGWSGTLVNIPAGWFLCNGTNGTPNLLNRFIVGAGSTYALGAIGGAVNVSATVSIGAITLTEAQMPVHQHIVPWGENPNTYTPPWGTYGAGMWGSKSTDWDNTWGMTSWAGGGGSHAHAASASAANVLPPYYALFFIMKG